MEQQEAGRSARKRQAIVDAATTVFLSKGYSGTSMDEIAALAAVSKQTVYKHFANKERLFAEIVRAATDQVDRVIQLVADAPITGDLSADLGRLARELLTTLMRPQLIRLRRLLIANADRFPELGLLWYERGFERALASMADMFTRLADQGQLRLADPMAAAHHFAGMLLWIPMNKVMFCGDRHNSSKAELHRYADAAVAAFIAAYGNPERSR